MKSLAKSLTISFLSSVLLVAHCTQADTVFGIYAGAGSWLGKYSGSVGDPAASAADLGMDDKNTTYYYVAIEHPMPFFPNIKLQHNDIRSKQTSAVEDDFRLDDITFPSGTTLKTDFDLSYTDATLYYEVLDNWLNLDLGVTLRKHDGYLHADTAVVSEKVDVDLTLPLVYGKLQFDLPLTGFIAGFEGNYIGYDGSELFDYTAKVGYLFDSALDLGLEAGYRSITMNIDEDDVAANLELKGPYLAIVLHF